MTQSFLHQKINLILDTSFHQVSRINLRFLQLISGYIFRFYMVIRGWSRFDFHAGHLNQSTCTLKEIDFYRSEPKNAGKTVHNILRNHKCQKNQ